MFYLKPLIFEKMGTQSTKQKVDKISPVIMIGYMVVLQLRERPTETHWMLWHKITKSSESEILKYFISQGKHCILETLARSVWDLPRGRSSGDSALGRPAWCDSGGHDLRQ